MLTIDIRQRCKKQLNRESIVFSPKVAGIIGYPYANKQKKTHKNPKMIHTSYHLQTLTKY